MQEVLLVILVVCFLFGYVHGRYNDDSNQATDYGAEEQKEPLTLNPSITIYYPQECYEQI